MPGLGASPAPRPDSAKCCASLTREETPRRRTLLDSFPFTALRPSQKEALLQAHGSRDESVLISPSLYQGVDLKDELSRFQVLVKVPYPDLSERGTRVKMERDQGWYDWQTALRLVQTYGRSIRTDTDHAVTYVFDSNFPWFVRRHQELFPEYFPEYFPEAFVVRT